MGAREEFECLDCGAAAVVSGGPDAGTFSRTITIGCRTCGQLDDLAITRFGKELVHDADPLPPCRSCGSDAVAEWSAGDPCPACGGRVERTGRKAMLWD